MQQDDLARTRFVRALLPDRAGHRGADGRYLAGKGKQLVGLDAADVIALVELGVLSADEGGCHPTKAAGAWVRRRVVETQTPLAAPDRQIVSSVAGSGAPLERPPASIAVGKGMAFLEPHHIEAAERFRQLFERAQLRTRVTMSYDAARTASAGAGTAHDLTDMAADARRTLSVIVAALPSECAGVVLDVCGFEKGLQLVEAERRWPRRSAKLVLRIGLDQLARHFGLDAAAVGKHQRRAPVRAWIGDGARPPMFVDP